MLENIFWFLHNATTLLFGVYISAAFLGIKMTKKNIFSLLLFSCATGALYILSFILFKSGGTEKIYPFIIHIPLIFFLSFKYKYKFSLCTLSVLMAYLCCQISNWAGIVALNFSGKMWICYFSRCLITAVTFIFLIRHVSQATSQLLTKPTSSIIIFGILPLVYYIFDYVSSVYTTLLYSGKEIVVEFMGFVLCISYIIFIFLYFKQYEEKRDAENLNILMEMKRKQSEKEIEAIKKSETSVRILRHDLRHFLLNIHAYIENGETDKALNYINKIISASDSTAMHKYCKNELVNMILSSHEDAFKNNNIDFTFSINIPDSLPISEIDLTAILSNALENAINAVKDKEKDKKIELCMTTSKDKLLLQLKNTFLYVPVITDGFPISEKPGHGIGTQSIRYVTEKLNGNCQFSISDDKFILRVII